MKEKLDKDDIVVIIILSVLLLIMLFSGITKSETSLEFSVENSVIAKGLREYKLTFTDGETSEVSCYVADLFDNGTQLFCADEDYEFMNIYGNLVKVEIISK